MPVVVIFFCATLQPKYEIDGLSVSSEPFLFSIAGKFSTTIAIKIGP